MVGLTWMAELSGGSMSAVRRVAARVAPWSLSEDHPEPLLAAIHFAVQGRVVLDRADRDAIVDRVLTRDAELLDPESPYCPCPDFADDFDAFRRLPVR